MDETNKEETKKEEKKQTTLEEAKQINEELKGLIAKKQELVEREEKLAAEKALSGESALSETHDVMAMSSQGVKVSTMENLA